MQLTTVCATHESFLEASKSITNSHLYTQRFLPHQTTFRSYVNQNKAVPQQMDRDIFFFFFKERAPSSWQVNSLLAFDLEGRALAGYWPSNPHLGTFVQDPNCPIVLISPKPDQQSPQKCNKLPRNQIHSEDDIYWQKNMDLKSYRPIFLFLICHLPVVSIE